MSFFEELKRRNVFRVGIAYGVAAWVLLQVADLVLENINAPDWVIQAMMMMVGLGFIAALVIAWAYEMTPEGIKKEADVDRSQSVTPDTGRKMDRIIIGFLVIAVAVLLYRQSGDVESIEPAPSVAAEEITEPAAPPESEEKSIAVLPFVNMSSDPEQEYFSDGLSEELLNRLAKNDQLHVAARTSAFQFKGQNLDIADIGRQLNVAHVLEGSVRKAGSRLRITAQLIQVDNGFHLWSETYEREMDDVFAIQDEIAVAISRAMEIELGTSSDLASGSKPTSNLEAYNLYLQARHLLAQRGDDNMRRANELFAEAVALDPGFVSAWSGLAFNMSLLYSYSPQVSLEESHATTMSAAQRAIELDPDNSEAYTAIGRALAANRDWKGAKESFERAYALGPKDVGVLNLYADFLWQTNNIYKAKTLKKQANDLDPLSGVLAGDFAEMSAEAGQFDEALVAGERGIMLAPQSFERINSLWAVLVTKGDYENAWSLVEETRQSLGEDTALQYFLPRWQAALHYRQGNEESLRKLLDSHISVHLGESEATHALEPALIGFYILSLDGIEEALPWFEQAYQEKGEFLVNTFYVYLPELISHDPEWLAFWDKPGLRDLMEMRRAYQYDSHGLWKSDSEINETNK
jgi:TolB-like protein/Tfp pilus assembly protein PilF